MDTDTNTDTTTDTTTPTNAKTMTMTTVIWQSPKGELAFLKSEQFCTLAMNVVDLYLMYAVFVNEEDESDNGAQ